MFSGLDADYGPRRTTQVSLNSSLETLLTPRYSGKAVPEMVSAPLKSGRQHVGTELRLLFD